MNKLAFAILSIILIVPSLSLSDTPKPITWQFNKVPVYKTVTTYRSPVGHTHTCRNGHTWDHMENPSHVCKICGASQYYQDRTPQMVPITRTKIVME